jgi:CRP/FNR family transcriptional regulator, cyclic AMP receptor protein
VNLVRPAVPDGLRALPEADRLTSLQRCTSLFAQSQPADALFLIEQGLVKLTRANEDGGGKLILAICGPGQLIGEEALSHEPRLYYTEGVAITTATIVRLRRDPLLAALASDSELATGLVSYLLAQKLVLAEKVELLCLHDVEYRILHYLAQLSDLMAPANNGDGSHIPITQLELADLIGATRETTSTTLNQLERRGLIKLSRRLLTVPSAEMLRSAAQAKTAPQESPKVSTAAPRL